MAETTPEARREELLSALREELPEKTIVTDADVIATHSIDRAMFALPGKAAVLVRAGETAHVQHVMRVASRLNVPVVPQGARSGLSGAAAALDGSILLSLEAMNQILEIDVANRVVVTEPGVMNAELSRAVEARGLYYPPDPSSWEFCSIGGNIATNSGGLCCVKYGVTTDYVLALEVVLADGRILNTGRRTVKGVAGYDLTKLFVGSEGTLGVITKATLSLRNKTAQPLTVVAAFGTTAAAAEAVTTVMAGEVVPALLEYMDQICVRAVNDAHKMGFPDDTMALLMAQSDAGGEQAVADVAGFAEIFERTGATEVAVADDPAEGELLLAARREVLTAFEKFGTTLIDDVCVPRDRLADLVAGIEKLSVEYDLMVGLVGHAGDGNFHPTVVFDPNDPAQSKRAARLFDVIMELSLELGGTITGEHGVGTLKMNLLETEIGEVGLDVHRRIKQSLDPQAILNPGRVFRLKRDSS